MSLLSEFLANRERIDETKKTLQKSVLFKQEFDEVLNASSFLHLSA